MPDQDEFEQLAKQWRPGYDGYLTDMSSLEIANEALRVATYMLRDCGGCPILPQLSELLWDYQMKASEHTLWNPLSNEAFLDLYEALDDFAGHVIDQRVSTIAVRSAKTIALQLQDGEADPDRPFEMKTLLATQVIKDLIGHSFLDTARANSVGERFHTSTEAHLFYDEVMKSLNTGVGKIATQLARRPTGKRLRQHNILPVKPNTRSILFDKAFRLDL